MTRFLHIFERVIVVALILLMAFVILGATVEFALTIAKDFTAPPLFQISVDILLDIFGNVLLILIGLELLDTIKAYLIEHAIHVEVVLEVALIAVARKVIVLNVKEYPSLSVLAIAALILALAVAYYLEKMGREKRFEN